jgi:hypothetical protein
LTVVVYVPDNPPAASATEEIASAARAATRSVRYRLECIDFLLG